MRTNGLGRLCWRSASGVRVFHLSMAWIQGWHGRRWWVVTTLLAALLVACVPPTAPVVTPTPTPEPLIPTPVRPATRTPVPTVALTPLPTSDLIPDRWRFGVGVALKDISRYDLSLLRPGWYLDWQVRVPPSDLGDVEYMPMVRVSEEGFRPAEDELLAAVDALPGATWLIGNEPDVRWQDGVTPETYARRYHTLYGLIKGRDPSAQIAIGGVSQPTALRLRYLDRVLAAYQEFYGEPMPVDVWNVHAFILREEADSWGVGIPLGFDDRAGELYEIDDHDDMEIFARQILGFRYWMWLHGEQDKPLIVSEYGILMPEDYGFPPERVRRFMWDSFDYFLSSRDEEIGYPEDDFRLVQRWCWYSLADTVYPTPNLFDPETLALTPLGEAFALYLRGAVLR